MGRVRPFIQSDLSRVADLSRRLFAGSAAFSQEEQIDALRRICLENPWGCEECPSLVYEDDRGQVVGFIAVTMRPMEFRGEPVRLAVSQHWMVDPESRAAMAGIELIRKFLAGPQDLSMADMSDDISRKVFSRLGGEVSLLNSILWSRPLRPARQLVDRASRHTPLALLSLPFSTLADAVATRLPVGRYRQEDSELTGEKLTVETLEECLERFSAGRAVRPAYDRELLNWLLGALESETRYGNLQRVVLRNAQREIVGWYIYFDNIGDKGEVIQVGGADHALGSVLKHLFHHAWQRNVVELAGRLDPRFMRDFTQKFCLFQPGLMWTLLHSRNTTIIDAIQRGDGFLSRLEGDLWLL